MRFLGDLIMAAVEGCQLITLMAWLAVTDWWKERRK